MSDEMNIFVKLNKIMSHIGKIEKSGQNVSQNYKFIEQAVVMAKLRPLFAEHGLVIVPQITRTEYRALPNGKSMVVQCDMHFTIVNADNPSERIEADWVSEGGDTGDKAINKAGTSGLKYFLLKLLMISEKDDPDAESPGETKRGQDTDEERKRIAAEVITKIGSKLTFSQWQELARNYKVIPIPNNPEEMDVNFLKQINAAVTAPGMDPLG